MSGAVAGSDKNFIVVFLDPIKIAANDVFGFEQNK